MQDCKISLIKKWVVAYALLMNVMKPIWLDKNNMVPDVGK